MPRSILRYVCIVQFAFRFFALCQMYVNDFPAGKFQLFSHSLSFYSPLLIDVSIKVLFGLMAHALQFLTLMNLSDFLIIYLACGAPFGIYFFLQHRHKIDFRHLYLKSAALIFVWIPYALRLLYDFVTKRSRIKQAKKSPAYKLDELQKQISQLLFDANSEISFFEFREIFERYIGLTIAQSATPETHTKPAEEIFRVALRQNIKLGAECLHRRNRQRILRHQIQAREDFLKLAEEILQTVADKPKFESLIYDFVQTLNDSTAQNALAKIFDDSVQRNEEFSVQYLESDLWTPPQKSKAAVKTPARL